MKPLRVEPEAKQELAAAVAWYEERREGLGRELIRVLAIAHEKRRPGYWVGRLKGP